MPRTSNCRAFYSSGFTLAVSALCTSTTATELVYNPHLRLFFSPFYYFHSPGTLFHHSRVRLGRLSPLALQIATGPIRTIFFPFFHQGISISHCLIQLIAVSLTRAPNYGLSINMRQQPPPLVHYVLRAAFGRFLDPSAQS